MKENPKVSNSTGLKEKLATVREALISWQDAVTTKGFISVANNWVHKGEPALALLDEITASLDSQEIVERFIEALDSGEFRGLSFKPEGLSIDEFEKLERRKRIQAALNAIMVL